MFILKKSIFTWWCARSPASREVLSYIHTWNRGNRTIASQFENATAAAHKGALTAVVSE